MKVAGAFYGYSVKGKAAFGVHLKSNKFQHKRIIKLKNATTNAAELHALEYALKAIKTYDAYVSLKCVNALTTKLLATNEAGEYLSKPERNVELTKQVRKASERFVDLDIQIGKSDLLLELQEAVKEVARKDDMDRTKD